MKNLEDILNYLEDYYKKGKVQGIIITDKMLRELGITLDVIKHALDYEGFEYYRNPFLGQVVILGKLFYNVDSKNN